MASLFYRSRKYPIPSLHGLSLQEYDLINNGDYTTVYGGTSNNQVHRILSAVLSANITLTPQSGNKWLVNFRITNIGLISLYPLRSYADISPITINDCFERFLGQHLTHNFKWISDIKYITKNAGKKTTDFVYCSKKYSIPSATLYL